MKNTRFRDRRRTAPMLALTSATALLVAGCGTTGDTGSAADSGRTARKSTGSGGPPSTAIETGTSGRITVKAAGGALTSVDVSAPGPGKPDSSRPSPSAAPSATSSSCSPSA
ncbi:hypothetical protein [Streptomyces sp. NPDC004284]|uniref:hypothetical protein n=1 Tax=Streptomyces sp. NPDC004284 TaxID=3364695 RepID=UPI0036C57E22